MKIHKNEVFVGSGISTEGKDFRQCNDRRRSKAEAEIFTMRADRATWSFGWRVWAKRERQTKRRWRRYVALSFISFLLCRNFLFVCPELLLNNVAIVEDNYESWMLDVQPEQKVKDAQLLMLHWVCRHCRKLLLVAVLFRVLVQQLVNCQLECFFVKVFRLLI